MSDRPASASQGGLDLEALKEAAERHRQEWNPTDHKTDRDLVMESVPALIDRVRELEAERDHAISQSKHMSRLFNEQTARLASLRRVREAAVEAVHYGTGKHMAKLAAALADEGEWGHSPRGRVVDSAALADSEEGK